MNRMDLLSLALKSGALEKYEVVYFNFEDLERFANFVASAEREACANIAESKRHSPNFSLTSMPPQNGTAVDIANAIRARGQA